MSHIEPERGGRGCPECGETNGHAIDCEQREAYHQEGVIKEGPTIADVKREMEDIRLGKFDPEHYPEDAKASGEWTHEEADKVIGQLLERETNLKRQLAAERETREVSERSAKAWEEDAHRYATNLAAEREAINAAVKEAYEKGKQDGLREHYVGK